MNYNQRKIEVSDKKMVGFVGKRSLNMIIKELMRVWVFQICGFSMKIFFADLKHPINEGAV